MNLNLIIAVVIAIAAGVGIYYIYLDLQREKQRTQALALHLRKLEGLVWAYNIRGRVPHHMPSDDEDDDDDDEDDSQHNEDDESESNDVEEVPDRFMPGPPTEEIHIMSSMATPAVISLDSIIFGAAPGDEMPDDEPPRIEEIVENDTIPEVVSFDAFNDHQDFTQPPPQINETPEEIEQPEYDEIEQPEHDEIEQPEHDEIEQPEYEADDAHEPIDDAPEEDEAIEAEEVVEQIGDDENDIKAKMRVYADTYQNRKLNRVGQPY